MHKNLHILKLLSDLGANPARPGAAMGPDALLRYDRSRKGVFAGCSETELKMPQVDRQAEKSKYPHARFANHIATFQQQAALLVTDLLNQGKFPLVLSGDHSSAAAILAGIRGYYPTQKIGVIWIDAHADLHTPFTTPSGNLHGMPVAASLAEDNRENGHNQPAGAIEFWELIKANAGIFPKISPADICYVELRDTEPEEQDYINRHNIIHFTPEYRRKHGLGKLTDEVCGWAAGFDHVYVTFDIDSMDMAYVPGTGTPVAGGFSPDEAAILLSGLWHLPNLTLFEITEINPELEEDMTLGSVYRAVAPLSEASKPLTPEQECLISIEKGEDQFREFKSAWEQKPAGLKPRNMDQLANEIAEHVVSFGNAEGGTLYLGVEDDRQITGIPELSSRQLQSILNHAQSMIEPKVDLKFVQANLIQVKEKNLLAVHISKYARGILQLTNGRCIHRVSDRNEPCIFHTITQERNELASRAFESALIERADLSHLNIDLITKKLNHFLPDKTLTVPQFLQYLKLANHSGKRLAIRNAGLLLFANDIDEWHPRCMVRFLTVNGIEILTGDDFNEVEDVPVKGNIFEIAERAWERLKKLIQLGTPMGEDGKFNPIYAYPPEACREALINAITHRDYTIMSAIEIHLFDNRIEFKNPGALVSGVPLAVLRNAEGGQDSRNPLIARAMKESGYVLELGEGFRRIHKLLAENGYPSPEIISNGSYFKLTFYRK